MNKEISIINKILKKHTQWKEILWLQPSIEKIKEISKYVEEQGISYTLQKPDKNQQAFRVENKWYILDEKDIKCQQVYIMLLDLANPEKLTKVLNKQPNLLRNYFADLKKTHEKTIFKSYILNKLPLKYIEKIIEKCFSRKLCDNLMPSKKEKYYENNEEEPISSRKTEYNSFRKNTLSRLLGETFLESFILINYIYNIEDITNKDNHESFQEYKYKNKMELQKVLSMLTNKQENKELEKIKKVIINYIEIFCDINDFIDIEKMEYHAEFVKLAIEIGVELIEMLTKADLLTEYTDTKRKIPYLRLNAKMAFEYLVPASCNKPQIFKETFATGYQYKKGDDIHIELDIMKEYIPNKGYVHIKKTSEILEIIKYYSDQPMCINEINLYDTLKILEQIYDKLTQKEYFSETMLAFLKSLYGIDFKKLFENNQDENLVKELIRYALNLDFRYQNKTLEARCENNLACYAFYHHILAYKLFFIGYVNESYIYSHFNFFYISRYITNTGRYFSATYFLQNQGIKLPLAMLKFPDQPEITQLQLNILQETFEKILQTKVITFSTIEEYKQKIQELTNDFIKSFLTEVDLNEYPKNNPLEQLLWISNYCKKPKYNFYVKALLDAKLTGENFLHLMYEKDATCSGIQMIALCMRDEIGATQTNLIGTAYNDIYTTFINKFNQSIQQKRNHVDQFFKQVLQEPMEIFFARKPSNTLGYMLQTFFLSISNQEEEIKLYENMQLTIKEQVAFIQRIKNFRFTLLTPRYFLIKSKKKDIVYDTLVLMKDYIQLIRIIDKLPEDLISRKTFKQIVMPYGYGQGDRSRKQELNNYIKDYFIANGYHKIALTKHEQEFLVDHINMHFHRLKQSELSFVKEFKEILQKFVKNSGNTVRIRFPYFSWGYNIKKDRYFRHRVKIEKKNSTFYFNQ